MYLDDREPEGLVTTGRGNLLEPISQALNLNWTLPDKSIATSDEVTAAWSLVKSRQDLKREGGLSKAFQELTSLRLSEATVNALVTDTLQVMAKVLETRLPCIATAPADAQLALLRWAWGNGPSAHYPAMFAAIEEGDFRTAALQAVWSNENIETRSVISALFRNAAVSVDMDFAPEVLIWPDTDRPAT